MVHNIKKYVKILIVLFALSFQKISAYKISFFIKMISITLWLISFIAWILIAYQFTDDFGGLNKWHYIGFIGMYHFSINLFFFFFLKGLKDLTNRIYEGRIDSFIIKPANSQLLSSIIEYDIEGLISGFFGLMLFLYASFQMDISINLYKFLSVFYVITVGIITLYSIIISMVSLTFWIGRVNALFHFMRVLFDEPSSVPTKAFRGFLQIFFYYVFPVSLIATVPTSFIYFGIDIFEIIIFTLIMVVSFLISRFIWDQGLKSYSSASS